MSQSSADQQAAVPARSGDTVEQPAVEGYVSLASLSPGVQPDLACVFADQWSGACAVDSRDLQVTVDDPQRHATSMETFMTFRVSTKTCRIEYDETEFVVRRRYSDFAWLRHCILQSHSFHIVPPLPERHSLFEQLDRFHPEFIYMRQCLLHRFVNRLADHPVLGCHRHFRAFLTLKPSDFSVHRQRESEGVIARVSSSLQKLSLPQSTERPKELAAELQCVERLTSFFSTFQHTMAKLQQLLIERAGVSESAGSCCLLWAATEPDIARLVTPTAAILTGSGQLQRHLAAHLRRRVLQPLHEYVLFGAVVAEAASRRDLLQAQHERLCLSVQQRHDQRQQIGSGRASAGTLLGMLKKSAPISVEAEEERVSRQIETMTKQRDEMSDRVHCADTDLVSDLARWQCQRRCDMKQIVTDLAHAHAQYYKHMSSQWQTLASQMSQS